MITGSACPGRATRRLPAVRVLLVRHGCAGNKREWHGPDAERPLDDVGVRQSEALADELGTTGIRRLATSPTRRCRDTVAPLAHRVGLPVEDVGVLAVDTDPEELLALLTRPDAHDGVFCTHGELMARLLEVVRAAGTPIDAPRPDDGWLLGKGTGWDLTVDERSGRVVALRHVQPHRLVVCRRHAPPAVAGP